MPAQNHQHSLSTREVLSGAYQLAKDYFWNSNQRYQALLLLAGLVISIFVVIAIVGMLGAWSNTFWFALTEMNYALFVESAQMLCVLIGAYIGANVFGDYLAQVLTIRWRVWLTESLIDKYLNEETHHYLELKRHSEQIDNPEQRIHEDVRLFVENIMSLGVKFFTSLVNLVFFLGILWTVGGALTFSVLGLNVIIPGYMVWAAFLFAATSSGVTHLVGRALKKLVHTQEASEADFRKDLAHISADSESIAQDHGEHYYKSALKQKLAAIRDNATLMISVKNKLTAFKSFYEQASWLLPYLIAAPLYFMQRINTGQLFQTGFAFGQIQYALSWFISSYEDISQCRTSVERVIELERILNGAPLTTAPKAIRRLNNHESELSVHDLSVTLPSSTSYLMKALNLTFKWGENTLIKARSGYGKSTLFKAIAGTWRYGQGEVFSSNGMFFLPQKPSLPNDTLKAVLAYPRLSDAYSDAEYEEVLRAVGNMDQFIGELNTKANWSTQLSGGEQQRISFARALLMKPKWLFLDEATSSLDVASEQHMYGLVRDRLKASTTFISIAHRTTVDAFHDRVVHFERDDDGKTMAVSMNDEDNRMRFA